LSKAARSGAAIVTAPWTAMIDTWLAEERALASGEIVCRLRRSMAQARAGFSAGTASY